MHQAPKLVEGLQRARLQQRDGQHAAISSQVKQHQCSWEHKLEGPEQQGPSHLLNGSQGLLTAGSGVLLCSELKQVLAITGMTCLSFEMCRLSDASNPESILHHPASKRASEFCAECCNFVLRRKLSISTAAFNLRSMHSLAQASQEQRQYLLVEDALQRLG